MEQDRRSAFKILTDKATGKSPLGRPRYRLGDNIRIDLKEVGVNRWKWIDSSQDRDFWRTLVNSALDHQVSKVMELVRLQFFVHINTIQQE